MEVPVPDVPPVPLVPLPKLEVPVPDVPPVPLVPLPDVLPVPPIAPGDVVELPGCTELGGTLLISEDGDGEVCVPLGTGTTCGTLSIVLSR